MSSSSARIESEAHHFLDEARNRNEFKKEFDSLPLREQLAVTRAMKRQEQSDEKQHPELPKVTIETFQSGYLREVDVQRSWIDPRKSLKEVYKQDHDPAPKSEIPAPVKSILHGLGEVVRLKRTMERKVEDELLKQ